MRKIERFFPCCDVDADVGLPTAKLLARALDRRHTQKFLQVVLNLQAP